MFADIYRHKRVIVTGHTGFKGSWLTLWLQQLGADVCGISLPMPQEHSHFQLLNLPVRTEYRDLRCNTGLEELFQEFQPQAVFHLAAQALVRTSYLKPLETYEVNVLGTARILEACRKTPSVQAIVAISSDKCYENREVLRPYCEDDPMGGYDPYSASKGCMELLLNSYRRSFFTPAQPALLASARAGNVIGGGDWAEDRLVPELMQAATRGETAVLRNPGAVRPWQHVLEPLSGYLLLGQCLFQNRREAAQAWNFGPALEDNISVADLAAKLAAAWPGLNYRSEPNPDAPHEASLLRLDCRKAAEQLQWHGVWSADQAIRKTAEWYRDFFSRRQINSLSDLHEYCEDAARRNLPWAN